MLSVRGNGLLSWIGNDNFVVDDSSATSTEASFLSLDLHALASKLEKIDVSRRLFIEADLLPPQQDVGALKETVKLESEHRDNRARGIAKQYGLSSPKLSDGVGSDVLPSTVKNSYSSSQDPSQGAVFADRSRETMSSTTSTSSSSVRFFSIEKNILVNQVKDDSIQIESNVEVVDKSIDRKASAFEALAAEAELDMLLNSFGETDLPKAAGVSNKPVYDVPISHSGDSATTVSKGNIDDTIDDLLRDASITTKHNSAFPKQEVVVPPHVPASSSKPTAVLDDFDSWLNTL